MRTFWAQPNWAEGLHISCGLNPLSVAAGRLAIGPQRRPACWRHARRIGWHPDVLQDAAGVCDVRDERDDTHLTTVDRAQLRQHLIDSPSEGLNLHRACRTVLLLHPEWSPAVVEQQIGRVDRLGSRWEQLVKTADENSWRGDPPRIEILPIVFKGTYDEHQWKVLRERWNDLRAQLHGVVIPPSISEGDALLMQLAREINGKAPNFSPCE